MKLLLLSVFSFLSAFCFCQKTGTLKVKKSADTLQKEETDRARQNLMNRRNPPQLVGRGGVNNDAYLSVDLLGGIQSIKLDELNQFLFADGKSFSDERKILAIELGIPLVINRLKRNARGSLGKYTYLYPEKISTDSASYTLTGFHWNFVSIGSDIFDGIRWLDFIPYAGFDYGRLKLMKDDKQYSNPFFALQAQGDLRFNYRPRPRWLFAGIGLGIKGGYIYDVTKSAWKKKNSNMPDIPGTKMTGFYYAILLSIIIG